MNRVVELLLRLLDDACRDDPEVVGPRVLRALQALDPGEAPHAGPSDVDWFMARLQDAERPIRLIGALVLGHSGERGLVPRLVPLLSEGRREACETAAIALGYLGDARAVKPLVRSLGHWDPEMRMAAAGALGVLGAAAEPAMGALERLARREENKDVSRAMARAWERIERSVRMGPCELEAAEMPAGRGSELEAAPAGRGTELMGGDHADRAKRP